MVVISVNQRRRQIFLTFQVLFFSLERRWSQLWKPIFSSKFAIFTVFRRHFKKIPRVFRKKGQNRRQTDIFFWTPAPPGSIQFPSPVNPVPPQFIPMRCFDPASIVHRPPTLKTQHNEQSFVPWHFAIDRPWNKFVQYFSNVRPCLGYGRDIRWEFFQTRIKLKITVRLF